MKKSHAPIYALILAMIFSISSSFKAASTFQEDSITGAWIMQDAGVTDILVFIDDYMVMSSFEKESKNFIMTTGGPYSTEGDHINITVEFNSLDSTKVGQKIQFKSTISKGELTHAEGSAKQIYKQLDNGSGPLAGVWYIAGRLENGKIAERQLGPRRTLKILSGTRFQWIAINPSVKGFYGTGGGSYTFINGKYTENIEFFPRDNSRVGASLTFDGKIENGAWHHSGLSSRGEPLNEVWKKLPKK